MDAFLELVKYDFKLGIGCIIYLSTRNGKCNERQIREKMLMKMYLQNKRWAWWAVQKRFNLSSNYCKKKKVLKTENKLCVHCQN